MKLSKEEAIIMANDFIKEVNELEKKYNMRFGSDTGDIYFSFKTIEKDKVWDSVSLGWDGDGSNIKVIEPIKKELISISVYKNIMIDTTQVDELKKKLSQSLNTEIENISIELGYNNTVTY